MIALCVGAVVLDGEGLPGLRRANIGRLMRLEGYAFGTGFRFAVLLPYCSSTVRLAFGAVWAVFVVTVCLMGAVLWSTRPGLPLMAAYLAMVGAT